MAVLKFGPIVMTKGIEVKMKADADFKHFVKICIERFMRGDWALTDDRRFRATYMWKGVEFLIITEPYGGVTTILKSPGWRLSSISWQKSMRLNRKRPQIGNLPRCIGFGSSSTLIFRGVFAQLSKRAASESKLNKIFLDI